MVHSKRDVALSLAASTPFLPRRRFFLEMLFTFSAVLDGMVVAKDYVLLRVVVRVVSTLEETINPP